MAPLAKGRNLSSHQSGNSAAQCKALSGRSQSDASLLFLFVAKGGGLKDLASESALQAPNVLSNLQVVPTVTGSANPTGRSLPKGHDAMLVPCNFLLDLAGCGSGIFPEFNHLLHILAHEHLYCCRARNRRDSVARCLSGDSSSSALQF